MRALLIVVLLGLISLGCATARDGAAITLTASAEFGVDAERALELLDRGVQEDAIAHAPDPHAAVVDARTKFRDAWRAYRAFRVAWLAAAASVRVYDDAERAGLAHSETDFALAVVALVAAERDLVRATTALRGLQ